MDRFQKGDLVLLKKYHGGNVGRVIYCDKYDIKVYWMREHLHQTYFTNGLGQEIQLIYDKKTSSTLLFELVTQGLKYL